MELHLYKLKGKTLWSIWTSIDFIFIEQKYTFPYKATGPKAMVHHTVISEPFQYMTKQQVVTIQCDKSNGEIICSNSHNFSVNGHLTSSICN